MNYSKPYLSQTHPMGNLGSPFVEPFGPSGTLPMPQQQSPIPMTPINPNYDLERRMDQFEKWLNNIADALSKVASTNNKLAQSQQNNSKEDKDDEKSSKNQSISTKWFFVAVGLTNGIILILFIVAFIAIVFVVKHMAMNFLQMQKMQQMQHNFYHQQASSSVYPIQQPPSYQQNYPFLGK